MSVEQSGRPFLIIKENRVQSKPQPILIWGIPVLYFTAHFRAGFESWAGAIHAVSEPSLHDASNVTFRRLGRKLYPLDGEL